MKKIIYTLALGGIMLTSCNDWLDINQNPNNATQDLVTSDMLLTYAQKEKADERISYSYARDIFFLAQHLTKSGEVSGNYPFLNGLIMPQNVNGFWNNRYTRMANLVTIKNKAVESEDPGYNAIATTLMVVEFRELVDMFNNVPYTDALQGDQNMAPKYDKGADIYAALLNDIQGAIDNFGTAIADATYSAPGLKNSDIMFHGDLKAWQRYAYSIKLSLLMRISNVQDVASQVAAIADKCLTMDEMVTANPGYYKASGKMNPTYETWGLTYLDKETSYRKQNVPTATFVDALRENNDPRQRVYLTARTDMEDDPGITNYAAFGLENERYIGVPFGQMAPAGNEYVSLTGYPALCRSNSTVDGPLADVVVMSGSLVGFYLAEAALRGMIPGGDAKAQEYYEQAVISAMNMYEASLQDASIKDYGACPAITGTAAEAAQVFLSQENKAVNWNLMTTNEEKLAAIQLQKWISLFMIDPLEAWSEQRRTDYPTLLYSNCQTTGQKLVARLPYPDDEKNLNPENHDAEGEINVYTSLVFWDLKNEDRESAEAYQ